MADKQLTEKNIAEDSLLEDWNRLLLMEDLKYTLHRGEVDILLDFCLDALDADIQSKYSTDVLNILRKFVTYQEYTAKLEDALKKPSKVAKKSPKTKSKKKS